MATITECPHCQLKPLACPFCGKPASIFGSNMVGCSDTVDCGGNVDFGHWTGTNDDGVPAVHYVIEQWNKREKPKLISKKASPFIFDDD